jgi:hypothetical protein
MNCDGAAVPVPVAGPGPSAGPGAAGAGTDGAPSGRVASGPVAWVCVAFGRARFFGLIAFSTTGAGLASAAGSRGGGGEGGGETAGAGGRAGMPPVAARPPRPGRLDSPGTSQLDLPTVKVLGTGTGAGCAHRRSAATARA